MKRILTFLFVIIGLAGISQDQYFKNIYVLDSAYMNTDKTVSLNASDKSMYIQADSNIYMSGDTVYITTGGNTCWLLPDGSGSLTSNCSFLASCDFLSGDSMRTCTGDNIFMLDDGSGGIWLATENTYSYVGGNSYLEMYDGVSPSLYISSYSNGGSSLVDIAAYDASGNDQARIELNSSDGSSRGDIDVQVDNGYFRIDHAVNDFSIVAYQDSVNMDAKLKMERVIIADTLDGSEHYIELSQSQGLITSDNTLSYAAGNYYMRLEAGTDVYLYNEVVPNTGQDGGWRAEVFDDGLVNSGYRRIEYYDATDDFELGDYISGDGVISHEIVGAGHIVNTADSVHMETDILEVNGRVRTNRTMTDSIWHAHGGFQDSVVILGGTQNVWYKVGNATGNLWGVNSVDGFTMSGDTMISLIPVDCDIDGMAVVGFASVLFDIHQFRIYNITQGQMEGYAVSSTAIGPTSVQQITIPIYLSDINPNDRLVMEFRNITNSNTTTFTNAQFKIEYFINR